MIKLNIKNSFHQILTIASLPLRYEQNKNCISFKKKNDLREKDRKMILPLSLSMLINWSVFAIFFAF